MKGEGMRTWKLVLGAVLVVMAVCFGIVSSEAASPKFAAKVNGVGIRAVTLDAAINNFVENQKMLGVDVKEEDKEKLKKDILEELVSAELLYQESKRASLGDLSKEINDQFENIKKGFKSEEEFSKVLKDRGITEKDLKEDIEKGIYIKTFLEKDVYANIAVSDEEKKSEYENNKDKLDVPEQVKASHILIRVVQDAGDSDKAKAKEKIDALRQRALSGEDFAKLATENSEDGSAPTGGDLGYFGKGNMIKPFEDAAFSLEVGQVSPVVETQFGYHLIKVTDKKPAHKLSYEEVEEGLTKFLINRHREEKLRELVDSLRQKAKIEKF
jgi:peptidyl-prolyl cis-trans isomerase C